LYHEIREKYALPLPVIAGNVDKRFEPAYFKAEPVFDFF
jgi:hypothetical protein